MTCMTGLSHIVHVARDDLKLLIVLSLPTGEWKGRCGPLVYAVKCLNSELPASTLSGELTSSTPVVCSVL